MQARFAALMPSLLSPLFLTTQTPSSHLKPSFFSKPYSQSPPSRISLKMSSQTVEHIVLFKVKHDTDPSKVNTMVNGLNGLSSIDKVLHLTVGPIHSNHSTSNLSFTHMLHSQYDCKEDLNQYSAHPNHLGVVKELVFPICDDLLAFDWINSDLNGPLSPKPGSAMRVTLIKLKEGLCDSDKYEVLRISKGLKGYFSSAIEQSSVGENFSPPERAKGFSIATVSFCPSLSELVAADSKMPEFLASQKVNVMKFVESDIGVYYVIPTPESQISSLC